MSSLLSQIVWSVPKAFALAYAPIFVRSFIVSIKGKMDNTKPRDDQAAMSGMPKHLQDLSVRLKNAHLNQLESLGLYAGAVAIGIATKVPPPTLLRLTSYYLKSRLAYVLAYAAPQVANGMLRSATFFASMTSCILIYANAANAVADIA